MCCGRRTGTALSGRDETHSQIVVVNLAATRSATVINVYFIIAFTLADLWTRHVLSFESSQVQRELLRFFGITSLIILQIHALVASGYPRPMMLRAFVVQAVFYALFSASFWLMLPSHNIVVQLHIGAMAFASALFAIISFATPTVRAWDLKATTVAASNKRAGSKKQQ